MEKPKPFSAIPSLPLPEDAPLPAPDRPGNPYNALLSLHEMLGPIFRVPVPAASHSVTYVSDEAAVREVLEATGREFVKGPATTGPFMSIVPLHLIALSGPEHAALRAAAQEGVSQERLQRHFRPLALRHARRLLAGLREAAAAAGGAVADVDRRCRAYALDVMSEALFGAAWGAQDDYSKEGNPPAWAISELMMALHWRVMDLSDQAWRRDRYHGRARAAPRRPGSAAGAADSAAFQTLTRRLKVRGRATLDGAREPLVTLERLIRDEVARHRRLEADGEPADDILGLLLRHRPEHGPPLSDEQLLNLALTFLTMGHENVATAIAWTLVLLAEHPEAQEAVRREVLSLPGGIEALGDGGAAAPRRLPALTAAFDEAVRLYPPVPAVTRTPSRPEGAVVLGYHIPPGEELALNLYALHRLAPGAGAEPRSFCPGRAFRGQSFGGGGRVCLGRGIAYVEAYAAVASVLSELRLAPADDRPTRPAVVVSLRPREPRLRASRL